MDKGNLDRAIADYTAAIGQHPWSDGFAYQHGALARERKHDLEGALADFTTSFELYPSDPDAKAIDRVKNAIRAGK